MDTSALEQNDKQYQLTRDEKRKALVAIQPAGNWSQRTVWIEQAVYELNFESQPDSGVMRIYTELETLVLNHHPNIGQNEPITWQYGGGATREMTWGKLQGILSAQRAAAKASESTPKKEKKGGKK